MKKIITAFIFCFLCGECFSQAGEWVWIKGDSVPNQPGNYGVQGVPSSSNCPPSLYEPCEWTDLNGNFWLFGGYRTGGNLGDLWKYNPVTNEWTWMKGSGIIGDPGNYGTKGVPSLSNYPPARDFGITSWIDNVGNLWMFGGRSPSNKAYSDLWKYEISTNEWTWMKGSDTTNSPGIYGTQGLADTANNPAGRWECASAWTDNSGDLWLFGGYHAGNYNDLWRFNIASNKWTWMKGSQLVNQPGIYGTFSIEDSVNTPGARHAYTHWKDQSGNLWFFSGLYYSITNYNDLWRFNTVTNNWAWMGGSSTANAQGTYGTKCITSANNIPGSRFENRAAWKDQKGNFWFFGGRNSSSGFWNDLWMYCFSTNQWIWINGDNTPNPAGSWGISGVSSPTNKPNGRGGSVSWTDSNGHLYFFGGWGNYNDLWKYTIDTTCGVCPTSTGIPENNIANELLVFPNPANSSLTISFSSSSRQNIELRIYNTLGQLQLFQSFETLEKVFKKEINVEKLSEGIYFLQVKTKEGMISKKVIVNHP